MGSSKSLHTNQKLRDPATRVAVPGGGTMRVLATPFAVCAWLSVLAPSTAEAQSMDEALRLYEDGDYDEAAFALYDVLQNDASAENRDQAEIYLAESLKKLELYVPALFYYSDLFKAGSTTRYYLNAARGLLELRTKLHDQLFVPTLINNSFDAAAFGKLEPEAIAEINYMIGELSARQRRDQDAKAFLEYVPSASPLYAKARYLLGLIAVRGGKSAEARGHFDRVIETVGSDPTHAAERRLRNLAVLALARTHYGEGEYEKASQFYGRVPRYSEEWFDALYENAWSYFQSEQYGRALGELQSVTSPYFQKRHIPEAYVIQGTSYFVNCQWDRVRAAVSQYRKHYDPAGKALQVYLDAQRQPEDYYRDVVAGGRGAYALELARQVRRKTRFKDYHYMIEHMAWEADAIGKVSLWQGSRLQKDLTAIVAQHREQLEPAVGRWVQMQLANLQAQLTNFSNQVNVLDFEVADAERNWLEQGKEILKGRRARLPRPGIPSDQWQHWSFDREYWKDELGYYAHTLRSECE